VIDSLSYIGFTSPTAKEWTTFGPEVLGLELAPPGPDGAVRLRLDDAAYRIAVHPGAANDLAYLGWAVAGPDALADATTSLEALGITVHPGDATLAAERGVDAVAWFLDPFGFRHELSHGQRTASEPFTPGRAMDGFVTGDGGLGHAVLFVPDLADAERFYIDVLGFRLSDRVEDGVSIRFLHCNSRHHTLAFVAVPGMVGMHHLMLEVESLDDVGAAYDIVNDRGIPVAMTLGRHTNDHMTSFYVRTPAGFEIEYGHGGVLVDTTQPWEDVTYDSGSRWGHKPPTEPLFPGIIRPVESRA
jgi:2,3-dihydroxybiphenyl 1,2-dioxygenase